MNQNIIIRPVKKEDITNILALDRKITGEFFVPLLAKIYESLGIRPHTQQDLENELLIDEKSFLEYLDQPDTTKLYGAFTERDNTACGIIVFHTYNYNNVEIDLLMVDSDYRNQKIGKQLFQTILRAFPNTLHCTVSPFQHYNEKALRFYESLGFKRIGKGPLNEKNTHNISYHDLYFVYQLDIVK